MTGLACSDVINAPLWDMMMKIVTPKRGLRNSTNFLKPRYSKPWKQEILPVYTADRGTILSRQGGEKRYIHQTIFPVKTEKGFRIASLNHDITERKQAEEELQERETHSQSLLRLSRNLERAQTYIEVLNAARDEVRNIIGYQTCGSIF